VAQNAPGARLVSLPAGDAGANRAVTDALRRQPDAVVLIGFPDGIAPVLRALIAQGKGPTQIPTYGSDGLQNAELGALVDPANPVVVASMKGTTPAGAPAGIDHPFNARLFAAGVEPFFSASAYDCVVLVALAAVAARSDDPQAIRDHFGKNLTGKTICNTFLNCSAELKRRRTIHYQGASSSFDHWAGSEPGDGSFDVWTLGLDARPTLAPAAQQIRVP
jgi:branched-chain amino acid transport system substrate-binding protein